MLMLETPDEGIGHGASTAIAMSADNTDDNADNARDTLLVEDGLGDSERAVLRCIAEYPDAAQEETGMSVGIGRTAVADHTSSLQRRGLLKRVGSRKTGHWEVQGGAR